MSVVRLAFLGTPEFARDHLKVLLEDSHFEIVGVVTQPDRPKGRNMHLAQSPVKELALQHGLRVISPESIKTESVLAEIAEWKAEAAVVVAYGQIVPQKFLDLFPLKVVNVHASLLPRWRGAAPIQRSIQFGDRETGVSLQIMKLKLDAGDVIGSYKCEIADSTDSFSLHDELMLLGQRLLQVDFMDYLRGHLMPVPQDESLITYAHKIEKSEARIDWSKSAREIHCHVRAMVMGPGSVGEVFTAGGSVSNIGNNSGAGKKLKIVKCEVVKANSGVANVSNTKAGEVCAVGKDYFDVACGEGVLRVSMVQPESRAQMSVKDFLLGHPLKSGDQFK